MAVSSFLVLRQTPVAPADHADQLAELRPLVQGQKVLFLGRDNFVAYELRGARPFTAVRNYYDPNYVKPDLRLSDVFRKFDFDSVTPATLNRFPRIIEGDYLEGGLTSNLMAKDLLLYLEYVQELGLTSFTGPPTLGTFNLAAALGYGEQISNRVVDAIGDIAGGVRVGEPAATSVESR